MKAAEELANVCFDVTFFDLECNPVGTSFSIKGFCLPRGSSVKELSIRSLRFAPGRYYCDLAVLKGNWLGAPILHDVVDRVLNFEVEFPRTESGVSPIWRAGWGSSIPDDIEVSDL